MAYKNSDGASSAKQEFYNWAYFSQALSKLGESKGVSVNIPDRLKPPPEEVDWLDTISTTLKGAGTIAEAYKDKAFTQADEYLKTHTLEEYQEDIKNNNIPFQYDPVSMARLKYQHGKLAFSMAEQDFQDRVTRNEFNELSPEQVDAEYFKHVRKAMDEVKNSFGYDISDDSWFAKGFFADSPESRLKVLKTTIETGNKWATEQAMLVDMADLRSAVNDLSKNGAYVVGTILDIFDGEKNPKLAHYSPADKAKMVSGLLEDIAGREDGTYILQELEQWKPNFLDGKTTVRDMVGAVAWDTALKKAGNSAWKADALAWTEQQDRIDMFVARGDVGAVKAELNSALDRSGGVVNSEVEFLSRSVEAARATQTALIGRNTIRSDEEQKEIGKTYNANKYLDGMALGLPVNPENVVGTDKEHIDREFMFGVEDGRFSLGDILNMASNHTGGYNPARNMLKKLGNNVLSGITYDIDNLKGSNAADIKKPEYLDRLYSFWKEDPRKFSVALGDMNDYDKDLLVAVMNTNALGMDYHKMISAVSAQRKLSSTPEGKKELRKILEGVDDEFSSKDPYLKNSVRSKTLAYMSLGRDRSDALDRAVDDFEKENLEINGSYVPSKLFTFPEAKPAYVRDFMKDIIDKDIKTLSNDMTDGVITGYNPNTNTFNIVDAETRTLLKSYGEEEISNLWVAHIEAESKKAPEKLNVFEKILNKGVYNFKRYKESTE